MELENKSEKFINLNDFSEELTLEKNTINNLFKKADDLGACLNNLKIKFLSPGNRYVTAGKDFSKNEKIMRVPYSFYHNRINNKDIADIYEIIKEIEYSEQICVFLFFLIESKKCENSLIYDYIKTLPKDQSYFPVFYSDENKALIKGSLLISCINENMKSIRSEFEILKEKIKQLKNLEFKEYVKVRLTIGARIFDTDKENRINSVVPIADFINFHPEKVNCYWRVDEKKNFYIKAINEIKEGEEIFLFYGNKDNLYYLFWYAFTIEDNPEKLDSFPIELEDGKKLFLKTKLNMSQVYEDYCKLIKFENVFNSKNILKDIIKIKKIISIIKNIKNLLEERLSLYYYKDIEEDKKMFEFYKSQNDFNKLNIFRILIEEKNLILEHINMMNFIIMIFDNYINGITIRDLYSEFISKYINDNFIKPLFINIK